MLATTKVNRYSFIIVLILVTLVGFLFFVSSRFSHASTPSDFGLKEGDLISAIFSDDPDVYIINEHGYKRLFLNPEIFKFYGHLGGFASVKLVTPEARDAFPTVGLLRNCEDKDPKVYGVQIEGEDEGQLHWVDTSGEQAIQDDPAFFKKVFCINDKEFKWYKRGQELKSVKEVPQYHRATPATPAVPAIPAIPAVPAIPASSSHPFSPTTPSSVPITLASGSFTPTPIPTSTVVPQTATPATPAVPAQPASSTPIPTSTATPTPTPTPTPITTTSIVPYMPTNLTYSFTNNNATVQLSWTDNSTNETRFEILRQAQGSSYVYAGQVGANVTIFSDSPSAGSYNYTVQACNSTGCSNNPPPIAVPVGGSTSDTTPPSTPTGLYAGNIYPAGSANPSGFDLHWSSSTDNVSVFGYKVYKNGTFIVDTGGAFYNTSIGNLSAGTVNNYYSYTVAAYDASGNISPQSSPLSTATIFATSPSPTPTPTSSTSSVSYDNFSKNIASIFTRNLFIGSSGSDVKQLQALLVNEVNYPANLLTGYFGSITQNAVKRLQEKYGIKPISGYFGSITRKALNALIWD